MSHRTVSADGSELNQYQAGNKPEPTFSPTFPPSRGNLATPPVSGGPLDMNGGMSNGPLRRPGNPSPPSSVNTRLSDDQSKMEEASAHHYHSLKRFLQNPDRVNGSNNARDKLLRLSATQFHELSTDVYDEMVRRQQATGGPGRPPRLDIPSFLPPRNDFHEKRNRARATISSIQQQRFKDLATDTFCELERRFPHFTGPDSPPVGSHSPSLRGPGRGNSPPNGDQVQTATLLMATPPSKRLTQGTTGRAGESSSMLVPHASFLTLKHSLFLCPLDL
jgi:Spa2 homology domain (SHD) of GIT